MSRETRHCFCNTFFRDTAKARSSSMSNRRRRWAAIYPRLHGHECLPTPFLLGKDGQRREEKAAFYICCCNTALFTNTKTRFFKTAHTRSDAALHFARLFLRYCKVSICIVFVETSPYIHHDKARFTRGQTWTTLRKIYLCDILQSPTLEYVGGAAQLRRYIHDYTVGMPAQSRGLINKALKIVRQKRTGSQKAGTYDSCCTHPTLNVESTLPLREA